jgi:hypothetical protein
MSEVAVEMILKDQNDATFTKKLHSQLVQLMLNSELVTISSNTIRVETKEVTDKGMVRFLGTKTRIK